MQCFEVLHEHTVTVYGPPTITRDAGGGTVLTWSTTRTTGVKCLINAPMLSEQERFGQTQLIGIVTISTFDSSIQRGDKLTVTAGPPYVGASLHITGIRKQPGVAAIGFSDLYHATAEHIL